MPISEENVRLDSRFLVLLLVVLVAFWGSSCRRQAAPPQPANPGGIDTGDKNVAAEKLSQADQLYGQREDLDKVRLGVALLRQARLADYGNYDAAWKLAKFNYYLGSHTTDERERGDAFREGIDAAKSAVQLHGDRVEGHFWLGANYGGDAENSTLAGLANVEDIRNEMETALKLDDKYEGGVGYVGLGQLYLQAPRALGGDTQKAIEILEKGLKIANDNAVIRLNLARAYHDTRRDNDARKQIEYILTMTPNPNYLPEYEETVEQAKKLKEEIGG
jgi:tetratricopeptide (TPR) repeat protein